ncbi:hypothetical protein PG987_014745 [Apiospora arundinis]
MAFLDKLYHHTELILTLFVLAPLTLFAVVHWVVFVVDIKYITLSVLQKTLEWTEARSKKRKQSRRQRRIQHITYASSSIVDHLVQNLRFHLNEAWDNFWDACWEAVRGDIKNVVSAFDVRNYWDPAFMDGTENVSSSRAMPMALWELALPFGIMAGIGDSVQRFQ